MSNIQLQNALDSLNEKQKEAALHIDGPLLILAGAGSGKTKTLTTRLAYLIDEIGIPPQSTLTLTFTNKAAGEMRQRALSIISQSNYTKPLLATFHGFGRIFLEQYIDIIGRKNRFSILDNDDKNGVIKQISKQKKIRASEINQYISNCKNQMLSPIQAKNFAFDEDHKNMNIIYEQYEKKLYEQNALDFDDLLYIPYLIMQEHKELRDAISQKYQYIMVDEYQDTNLLQYELLRQLTSTHQNIVVVGDDDQSIYGWRGAEIRNILDFHKQFDNVKTIKLEQNYRSTTQILEVANRLISHNKNRLGKNLISQKGDGNSVQISAYDNEKIECSSIAHKIKELISNGESPKEIAILYRINALSIGLERALGTARVAYKIVGGQRFYERSEIKDLICYLRMVCNIHDDISINRIINKPQRSIGDVTKDKIFEASQQVGLSVYSAFENGYLNFLSARTYSGIAEFYEILNKLRDAKDIQELSKILTDLDIPSIYDKEDSKEYQDRSENIEEFLGQLNDFVHNVDKDKYKDTESSNAMILYIGDFLNDLSLSSAADPITKDDLYLIDGIEMQEEINCMSIHNAKGLEFKHVFVIAVEQGILPIGKDDQEEERRLGYVAFTRAKEYLYISYVRYRSFRGGSDVAIPSQFIKELKAQDTQSQDDEIQIGDVVSHKVFGTGNVIDISKSAGMDIYQVNFGGMKKHMIKDALSKASIEDDNETI